MPRQQPAQRPQRCAIVTNGHRCQRNGDGSPPLCGQHRQQITRQSKPDIASSAASLFADFMSGRPINRDATFGMVEDMIAQWTASLGADYRPDITGGEGSTHRRGQSGNAKFDAFIEDVLRAGQQAQQRQQAQQQQRRQRPPTAAEQEALARARAAKAARHEMGFRPDEPLSEDVIRERKKQLARQHHPDRGGDPARMAAINNAADVLLEML